MSQVTKRALEQSLKNLLLKKPLTKITIGDIAEDCGINRMTFYYHFKDIYDLVEWSCLEDARKALEEKKTYDTWQQGFLQIFEAVRDNKPFIMNVYHWNLWWTACSWASSRRNPRTSPCARRTRRLLPRSTPIFSSA